MRFLSFDFVLIQPRTSHLYLYTLAFAAIEEVVRIGSGPQNIVCIENICEVEEWKETVNNTKHDESKTLRFNSAIRVTFTQSVANRASMDSRVSMPGRFPGAITSPTFAK